ncbi:hypothetical protein ACJX0J_006326, partial [Zea mays]
PSLQMHHMISIICIEQSKIPTSKSIILTNLIDVNGRYRIQLHFLVLFALTAFQTMDDTLSLLDVGLFG